MLTILDRYILKRYLFTFLGMILLFVPIGIMANLAEKIGKIIDNEAPLSEVIVFYGNFTLVIGNLLFPIFLFLSIIYPAYAFLIGIASIFGRYSWKGRKY